MLTIRRDQMEVLRKSMRDEFVVRAVHHIERLLPYRFQELGQDKVRESIRYALAKAERYQLTTEYDVLRLLNFMYLFGFDADADPRYPWAAEILTSKQMKPTTKIDLLMRRAESVTPDING